MKETPTLETSVTRLLAALEPLLPVVDEPQERWVLAGERQQTVVDVRDPKRTLRESYGHVFGAARKLKVYEEARAAFEADAVLSQGQRSSGYWATLDAVLPYLIVESGRITKRGIRIDLPAALKALASLRRVLQQPQLHYEASCRLLGVNLSRRELQLPDGLSLHRLTPRERNQRQPYIQRYFGSPQEDQELPFHRTEIRLPLTESVDHSQDASIFAANNRAYERATTLFGHVLNAILLVSPGRADLGTVVLSGGLPLMTHGTTRRRLGTVPIGLSRLGITAREIPRIKVAYAMLSGSAGSDKVLSRALHRFILGRQRRDPLDRLVDYVIAWETLLLTSEGDELKGELSYRFSLNGAGLVSTSTGSPKPGTFQQFRAAYSARSIIVHGLDDKGLKNKLAAGGFSSLGDACSFLEEAFRKSLFWLAAKPQADRPYRAPGGWETFLWD
jgi:hypothetical protein